MSKEMLEHLTEEEDSLRGKYLTFMLDGEAYGIPIQHVIEIIGIQKITSIPDSPGYSKGIINLRGKIIPVIDIRIKFKKPVKDYNDRTCIIVVELSDIAVGLIVDIVSEVITISDENIVPPPDFKNGFNNRFINGIGKVGSEVKLLIDCKMLLDDKELERLDECTSHE